MIDFEMYFPVNEDSDEEFERYAKYLKTELEKVYKEKWEFYTISHCCIRCKSSVKDKDLEIVLGAQFQHIKGKVYRNVSIHSHNRKHLSGSRTWREFDEINEWCEEHLTKKAQEQLSLW